MNAAVAPAHRRGNGFHRLGLAADMAGQQPFQTQQPLPLPGGQPPYGNPRPGRHHPGNVGGGDGPGPLSVRGVLHQVLDPIPQLRRLFKPPLPHRLVELLLQSLPGGGAPGTAGLLHFCPGSPLVQQIDGLIRQVELRKIPDGQPHRLLHGLVRNSQVMVLFQPRLQGTQNPQGCFRVRLLHIHRPEPALQSRILFNIFPVFLPGGCPHHLQLSPAQGRLQDIRRVDGPLGRPRAHNGVHLIHKENHIPAAADLRQHIPEPLFKLAPVFGAGHQAGHIQAVQPLVLQLGRHVSQCHPLGKALGNGRFSNPRFPDQGRIVLILPAQNADDHVDLPVPADDRIHGHRFLNQILTELLQQFQIGRLLLSVLSGTPLQIVQRMGKQHIGADAIGFQHFSGSAVRLPGQGQQNVPRLHLPFPLTPGLPGGKPQNPSGCPGKPLGQGQGLVPAAIQKNGEGLGAFALQPQAPQQLPRFPGGLSQRQQQMHRPHIAVAHSLCQSGA